MKRSLILFVAAVSTISFGAPVPALNPRGWDSWEPVAANAVGFYSLVKADKDADCAKFRQLFVDAKLEDATFPTRLKFWYAPHSGIGEKFHHPPKIKAGEIELGLERLKFGLVPNSRQDIRAVLTADQKDCIYDHWPSDRYLKYAEAIVDPVLSALKENAKEIGALEIANFRKLCEMIRTDKWYSPDSVPLKHLCRIKETPEDNQKFMVSAFKRAIEVLELQKLGLRDQEKAYGETTVSDRLYRKHDMRAVFGGFDPVEIFNETTELYSTKLRCADQGFSKAQCRQIGVATAAFVIQYQGE